MSSATAIVMVVWGPKLVMINSAETDSPGQASILEDEEVTSTSVDAGDISSVWRRRKEFPPRFVD